MQVLYEGAIFEICPVGGIARYFCDVINRLPETIAVEVLAPMEANVAFTNDQVVVRRVRTVAPIKLVRSFWRKRQHRRIAEQMDAQPADLIHWTYYTGLCRRPIGRLQLPNVITVHDFIHESFPELDPSGEHSFWKRQAIEAADRICCNSQTTYEQLCERFPNAASRASVTMLGNSFVKVEAAPIMPQFVDRPYVMFVGRRECYKNFDVLVKAWQSIRSREPELALVVVGSPLKRREASRLGIRGDDRGIIQLGYVDDRVLKSLYQHSRAFVFPSKEEGFGLPALEAMESGAAVIASSCASLREVLGNAGHFFDADDVDSLADLLVLAAQNDLPDYETKRELGRERAAELTWEKTTAQTVAVYRELSDPAFSRS